MIEKYADIFKVLSDPIRLKIFEMLKSGKLCACKILEKFEVTQPTLSYHMKLLTKCGLIDAEKHGKWNYYSVNREKAKEVSKMLMINLREINNADRKN